MVHVNKPYSLILNITACQINYSRICHYVSGNLKKNSFSTEKNRTCQTRLPSSTTDLNYHGKLPIYPAKEGDIQVFTFVYVCAGYNQKIHGADKNRPVILKVKQVRMYKKFNHVVVSSLHNCLSSCINSSFVSCKQDVFLLP